MKQYSDLFIDFDDTLYDTHGNVNEWCWDYYGEYDLENTVNPTGAAEGTRHVYRGGGWNDFGKNMRSAYRAAGQTDYKSYNLGVRLVRNAAHRAVEMHVTFLQVALLVPFPQEIRTLQLLA